MATGELHWRRETPKKMMPNEIHVWRASLDLSNSKRENLLGLLSDEELMRVGRFHFVKDQYRYITARGILRKILGSYLGERPQKLRFEYTAKGKPILAQFSGYGSFHFNLSHSDTQAIYAFSAAHNIGVDIERIRDGIEIEQIAYKYFSQKEIKTLINTQPGKRTELFFQYWTRKEAYLKAKGEGISAAMGSIDVSSLDGKILTQVKLADNGKKNECWLVQDLFPGKNYAAAIAFEGGVKDLSYWHYLD